MHEILYIIVERVICSVRDMASHRITVEYSISFSLLYYIILHAYEQTCFI